MKIVVLAKEVPDTSGSRTLDPVTGLINRADGDLVPDEINERALEHALRYRNAGNDVEIIVLMVVPEGADVTARKLLACGADSAILVTDPAISGADAARTAEILSAAVAKIAPDLVIAGNESTDGRGGVVPAMLAEYLGWPVLPALDQADIFVTEVLGEVIVDGEQLRLQATLPAVISITESSAEPRFPNFKGIMQAKKKPLDTWSLTDLPGLTTRGATSVMVSATAREARVAGPKIVDDGTAAAQLIDFLAARKLV